MTVPPGAQRERTVLAWRRTVVSFTVVALLLARLAATGRSPLVTSAALAVTALVWACAIQLTRRRTRAIAVAPRRTLPVLVMFILLYCAMGTLLLVS